MSKINTKTRRHEVLVYKKNPRYGFERDPEEWIYAEPEAEMLDNRDVRKGLYGDGIRVVAA